MPWEPYIDAKFAGPFVDNLERIIRRDEVGALAWSFGVPEDDVVPFSKYRRADWYDDSWPVIKILLRRSANLWQEDHIEEVHEVSIEIENVGLGDVIESVAVDVQKRLRAVDMILRSAWVANPLDFAVGYTAEGQEGTTETFGLLEFDIGEHLYADTPRPKGDYWQAGGFTATLKLWEAKQ